ncbi:hypothetical protein, partial [Escherichia coli]|uniref:hypothetical protein n=1 Tax=Escherichia coli TaxID=562 RepID=UPI001BD4C7D4
LAVHYRYSAVLSQADRAIAFKAIGHLFESSTARYIHSSRFLPAEPYTEIYLAQDIVENILC